MIPLIWSGLYLVLCLCYYMVENIAGMHESASTSIRVVFPLVLAPICIIGAMVHTRVTREATRSWLRMSGVGLLTTIGVAFSVVLAYVIIFNVLDPGFIDVLNINAGSGQQSATTQIHYSIEVVYFLNFMSVLLAGFLASPIAAIGLRRPPLAKPQQGS